MTKFDGQRREAFLNEKIIRYLDRKVPPRNLGVQAQAEEMASLIRCVIRYAPQIGYEDWWPNFEDRLDEDAKTRAWPTAGEIKSSALALTGPTFQRIAKGDEIDPLDLNARRMNAGEPVSDSYLFGRLAIELLESGKVGEAIMHRYRSGHIVHLNKTYDEATALAKVAELEARHTAALATKHMSKETRTISRPLPKVMAKYKWDGAA